MTRHPASAQPQSKSSKEIDSKVLIVASETSHDALVNFDPGETLRVSVTRSAEDTLQLCQQNSFDLAVIDFNLESSPVELARALHQQYELRSLFLIQDHHFDQLARVDDVGAVGFLAGACNSQHTVLAMQLGVARAQELRALANRESQLITALNAEREINTAIGVLMERMQLPRAEAFETLRRYARSQRQQMAQIAIKMLQSINDANELLTAIGSPQGVKGAK